MKRIVLLIIKLARRLFYNTPVHRSKIVNAIYVRVFHAAFKPGETADVTYEGLHLFVPNRDVTILPSLLNDCYEKYEIAVLRSHLAVGMTFVDVGANVGLFSAIGARAVGAEGRVFAFEPEPDNYELLGRNLERNGAKGVVMENAAAGNENTTMRLHLERNSIGTHSLLDKRMNSDGEIDVKVVRLEDYFASVEGPLDVLKIDVEGFEAFVLEGVGAMLDRVSAVFVEYTREHIEQSYGIERFAALLGSFPYLYAIDEKASSLVPFASSDFSSTPYVNLLATRSPSPCAAA